MLETFLVLFAGGIMLAVAIPNPRDVTLNWLRLGGIIALVFAGLSAVFIRRMPEAAGIGKWISWSVLVLCILGQLASAQMASRATQRFLAFIALVPAVACCRTLQPIFPQRAAPWPTHYPGVELALSWIGIAAMTGIVLMEMLLGHAYLTASKMTMRPFTRLNRALMLTIALRALFAIGLSMLIQTLWPIPKLWALNGLLIGTRWFVGLVVPAVFVYMVHDCIKRRATQSATGILYVAAVLIFIGEIVALQLVRDTGLPF